jgi:LuxR family maltose regulon positive regulatory protein
MEAALRPLPESGHDISALVAAGLGGLEPLQPGSPGRGRGIILLYINPPAVRGGSDVQVVERPGKASAPCLDILRPRLTRAEKTVMALLAEGKTNRAIARELFISVNTVKTHVRSIFQKLGVGTRSSAVRRALEAGLI